MHGVTATYGGRMAGPLARWRARPSLPDFLALDTATIRSLPMTRDKLH